MLEAATGAELMRSEALQRSHTAQPCAYAAPPGEAAVVALAWPDRLQVRSSQTEMCQLWMSKPSALVYRLHYPGCWSATPHVDGQQPSCPPCQQDEHPSAR